MAFSSPVGAIEHTAGRIKLLLNGLMRNSFVGNAEYKLLHIRGFGNIGFRFSEEVVDQLSVILENAIATKDGLSEVLHKSPFCVLIT